MALRTLLTEAEIAGRVAEIGREIDRDYPDGALYLICVLRGATIFHADLARSIQRDAFLEFIGASSYGAGTVSSGDVQITRDIDVPIEGAHVIIVEDIVDTGITLEKLTGILWQRRPKSLAVASLLDKPGRRIRPVELRYVGFSIADEFVVGYGLDFGQRYRNLRDLCVLEEENPRIAK